MSRKRRVFTLLISVILCLTMAVPVSAGTSYSQRYNAAQKMFRAIYYGKYSHSYNYGTDYNYTYDMDINKDGYPEHIEYYFNRDLVLIFTSYKGKVRRYVFKNSSVNRYKQSIVIYTHTSTGLGRSKTTWKRYNIKKGKLIEDKNNRYVMIHDDDLYLYYKGGKALLPGNLFKYTGKLKELKSSSYWTKLFNATKNFS